MATCQSETLNSVSQAPDPALAAYRLFTQAHDVMDNWPGEVPDHIGDAAEEAYKALLATEATSAAGAVAQLQGHLRWNDNVGNAEYDALCRIVADLTRFVPGPSSEPVAEDYHVGRYRDYLAALRTWATIPSGAEDQAYEDASSEVDDIADDLMTGPAATIEAVMLKARTAHHQMMASAQASTISPTVPAEYFGIIAADLEILTAGGRAVRS